MGYNAKQYAKEKEVSQRKIKVWFDAGYLYGATKNEKTGVYDIPEDTPVPYNADPRVKRISSLWKQLLEAADLQQAVYPGMYPLMDSSVVSEQIDQLAEAGLLTVQTTPSGASFLRITMAGQELRDTYSAEDLKKKLAKLEKCFTTACTLMQALELVMPLLKRL